MHFMHVLTLSALCAAFAAAQCQSQGAPCHSTSQCCSGLTCVGAYIYLDGKCK
ncbi:hypothetical protein BOTBODRAFT_57960 [Botryobasidium botryosum FD-172 SS1]|uniref:Uncharacterized protein n=1 Tax=Botryobasidium botryosum (strain FD-172 SS1) TaxID=930990 RepID=A0A067M768_BOTB1|nr:hypothetical protein BOTBODRAFT_57960 [Botryobasidium botryosum FD-172 SS1]